MPRAGTLAESLPPIVPASPVVAEAVRAYEAASAAYGGLGDIEGSHALGRAKDALEMLLIRLGGWHVVDGMAWGMTKVSKCGLTLRTRRPSEIRQAPNTRGDRQ